MNPSLRLSVSVFCLLFLSSVALGTTLRPREVTCPVCEKKIVVLVVRSTNSAGGQDRDLCRHAGGDQPRSFRVWTCPHCLYSRDLADFEKAPAPEIAERIRKELKSTAPIAPESSQRDIPGREKYRLAGIILEWESAKPLTLADHWLNAAWTTRTENWRALAPYRRDADFSELRARLGSEFDAYWQGRPPVKEGAFAQCRGDIKWATRLLGRSKSEGGSPEERSAMRLEAAGFLSGRGEHHLALRVLESLVDDENAPASVRKAAGVLVDEIRWERGFQADYLDSLARTIDADPPAGREMAAIAYIAGDTCRRLGLLGEAAGWFVRSIEEAEGPAWIFVVARDALERLDGDALPAEKLEAIRAKRLDLLGARLLDPETTGSAAGELRFLRDRRAEPHLVKALESEHAAVRVSAALAFIDQPEPGDGAVDGLCRQLADEERQPRWRSAVALERIGALRSRAALERAFEAEEDDAILRLLIDTLGFVGETETLPVLLKAYYIEDRAVESALGRLANRPIPDHFNTREELLEWWEKKRPGGRRDWVKKGFAEAGVPLADPWSRDSVPKLLDLLAHAQPWIRTNAGRCLREISGRRLPWYEIGRDADYPRAVRERNAAIAAWREWWEAEKPR